VKGKFDFLALARFLRFAMERHRQQLRFKALSITDDLTGLYNRRGFFELGEHQIKIAERAERELLLFYFDLDGFKSINDQWGHAEGDAALQRMSAILKDSFRSSDILARLGGDEFAILALEASKQHGQLLSNRVAEKLKSANEVEQKPYRLSMSIGQTCFYPRQAHRLEMLLEAADKELYANKKSRASSPV
jgi:diguanylate cyclase (GGDEF)-like protein